MTKKNFVTLILAIIGGILFAVGMCMALLPEWNAFVPGIVTGCAGALVLLAMIAVRRKMSGKNVFVKLSGKTIAAVALGTVGTLVFGAGLCMVMVWEGMMVSGIVTGVLGIALLLCLIPVCKGLK